MTQPSLVGVVYRMRVGLRVYRRACHILNISRPIVKVVIAHRELTLAVI